MILKAPSGQTFRQANRGERSGDIYASRNIDLENNWGKLKSSSPVLAQTLSSDNTVHPQSTPYAFAKATGTISAVATSRFWTIADDNSGNTRIFETSSVNGEFELDTGSPTLAGEPNESDILTYNRKLYVASGNTLYSRTSSTWSTVSTAIGSSQHLLSVYADRLYISTDTEVYSMNTAETVSTTGANTLDIAVAGSDFLDISTMRAGANGLWIGTYNTEGGRAKVIFWDGETENTPDATYKIDASGVVAMTIKNEVPYVLGSNGVLFRFNGSFFDEIDRFAFGNLFPKFFGSPARFDRFVHPNGMIVVRDEILIALTNKTGEDDPQDDPVPTRVPSGVWAWSETTGLYHKHSLGMQQDSDTIKDYGQVELETAGALYPLYESDKTDDNHEQSDFFVGYGFKTNNTTTAYAVGINKKRNLTSGGRSFDQASVVITPELYAPRARELWQKVFLRTQPLTASDKMVVKHRTQEYESFEADITWVNTTSFTSTNVNFANVEVGYEFEGLQGDGGGHLAHVSAISESSGTYTVTLDETITGATTNTARCRIDNWVKTGTITSDSNPKDISFLNVRKPSSKIQYKIYLIGDIEFEQFISVSKVDTEWV